MGNSSSIENAMSSLAEEERFIHHVANEMELSEVMGVPLVLIHVCRIFQYKPSIFLGVSTITSWKPP